MKEDLRFVSIISAPWKGKDTSDLTHSIYGLTAEGRVYRYPRSGRNPGWVALKMYETTEKPFKSKPRSVDDDEGAAF